MGVWEEQVRRTTHKKKRWSESQKFSFIETLRESTNEEEVKAAYIREFSLPVNTQERHDLVVGKVLFEFKYSVKLGDLDVAAKTIAQTIYYVNRLFKKGRLQETEYLIVADKDEARIFKVREFRLFYESHEYQWESFRPSDPDPKLIVAIKNSKLLESNRVYKLTHENDLHLFSSLLYNLILPREDIKKLSEDQNIFSTLKLFLRSNLWVVGLGLLLTLFLSVFIGSQYYSKSAEEVNPINVQ